MSADGADLVPLIFDDYQHIEKGITIVLENKRRGFEIEISLTITLNKSTCTILQNNLKTIPDSSLQFVKAEYYQPEIQGIILI